MINIYVLAYWAIIIIFTVALPLFLLSKSIKKIRESKRNNSIVIISFLINIPLILYTCFVVAMSGWACADNPSPCQNTKPAIITNIVTLGFSLFAFSLSIIITWLNISYSSRIKSGGNTIFNIIILLMQFAGWLILFFLLGSYLYRLPFY